MYQLVIISWQTDKLKHSARFSIDSWLTSEAVPEEAVQEISLVQLRFEQVKPLTHARDETCTANSIYNISISCPLTFCWEKESRIRTHEGVFRRPTWDSTDATSHDSMAGVICNETESDNWFSELSQNTISFLFWTNFRGQAKVWRNTDWKRLFKHVEVLYQKFTFFWIALSLKISIS